MTSVFNHASLQPQKINLSQCVHSAPSHTLVSNGWCTREASIVTHLEHTH